mgnify:CR=1 FL=1
MTTEREKINNGSLNMHSAIIDLLQGQHLPPRKSNSEQLAGIPDNSEKERRRVKKPKSQKQSGVFLLSTTLENILIHDYIKYDGPQRSSGTLSSLSHSSTKAGEEGDNEQDAHEPTLRATPDFDDAFPHRSPSMTEDNRENRIPKSLLVSQRVYAKTSRDSCIDTIHTQMTRSQPNTAKWDRTWSDEQDSGLRTATMTTSDGESLRTATALGMSDSCIMLSRKRLEIRKDDAKYGSCLLVKRSASTADPSFRTKSRTFSNGVNSDQIISKIASESMRENIFDKNSLEEKLSYEPYIIFKKLKDKDADDMAIQGIDSQKLIDFICHHQNHEDESDETSRNKIMEVFFLTHDLYISSCDLLTEIIKRFFIPYPQMLTEQEKKIYEQMVQIPSQFQILDVLAFWNKTRPDDFEDDEKLSSLMHAFIKYVSKVATEGVVAALELLLVKPSPRKPSIARTQTNLKKRASNPLVFYQEHAAIEIFLSYKPSQIALQMTNIDLEFIKEVRIRDLPHNSKNRRGVDRSSTMSGLQKMINYTNYLTFFWIYHSIHLCPIEKRKLVVRLIDVAEELLKLRNYQSFSIFMGILTNVAFKKICNKQIEKDSWIAPRYSKLDNFYSDVQTFRNKMKSAPFPKIPSLVVITEDITKLEFMFKSYVESETRSLLNYHAMGEIAEMINLLVKPESHGYKEIQRDNKLYELFTNEPIKIMRKLDPQLNINQIQTKLMSMGMERKNSLFQSLFG